MRSKTILVGWLGVLLLAGCAKHPTRPEIPVAEFSLVGGPTAGSPAAPVEFTARVRILRPDVYSWVGCIAGPIDFTLVDANGHRVNTWDPCQVLPACPVGWGPLAKESEHLLRFRFAGVEYPEATTTCPVQVMSVPSGRYTLHARFTYGLSPEWPASPQVQEREVAFDWESNLEEP